SGGRLSSTVMVGAAAGTVVRTFDFAARQWFMPEEMFLAWGWRVIFWFSMSITFAACLIRRYLTESPVFTELQVSTKELEEEAAPLVQAVKHGWKRIALVAIMNWGPNTNSYTVQTFFVTFVTSQVIAHGTDDFFSRSTITDIQLIGAIFGIISAFAWGYI